MQFDLFTFSAQVVNFLVLVALLRIFLYKPVLKAMDQRESRINSRLEEAEQKLEEAEEEGDRYRRQQQELQSSRERILTEAREEAEQRREELVTEAREEVQQQRKQWLSSLQDQRVNLEESINTRATETISEVLRTLVRDLADAELERQVVHTFVRALRSGDGANAEEVAAAGRDADGSVLVRSTFPLDDDAKAQIRDAIEEVMGAKLEARYSTSDDLVCGIELVAGDRRIAWTVESYIGQLERAVHETLSDELEAVEDDDE